MRFHVLAVALMLSACVTTTEQTPTQVSAPPVAKLDSKVAEQNFLTVVRRVEPVAEAVCRQKAPGLNCDYKIVVDDRPGQPANAFQTLDKSGRPIVAFTSALIADARNRDELAFVLGHEAAHHIARHIPQQQKTAATGAVVGGLLAVVLGAGDAGIETATRVGATVGARRYSKDHELEADALGTVIAKRAGYDPVRGAQYFTRIPDPGDQFLGSHPPNAQRIETVRRTAAGL